MSESDIDTKIIGLLEAVVAQNAALVRQNGEFLSFLKDRDARSVAAMRWTRSAPMA